MVTRYLQATQAQQSALRGGTEEIDIDAAVPKFRKRGKLHALRSISKLGKITYKALGFSGDNVVKTEVIANYLKDEYEARFHGADVIVPKWETHLANYLKRQKPFWGSPRWSVLVFWFVLFAATMVVAFVF